MKLKAFDIYPDVYEIDVEDNIMKRVVTYFGDRVEAFGETCVQGTGFTVVRLNGYVLGLASLFVVQNGTLTTSFLLYDMKNPEYTHTVSYDYSLDAWQETVEWFFGSKKKPVVNWQRVWNTIEEKAVDFDSYTVDTVNSRVIFTREVEIPRGGI